MVTDSTWYVMTIIFEKVAGDGVGGGCHLRDGSKYLPLSEVLRVLHRGREHSLPCRPCEHVQHNVTGCGEGGIKVQLSDGAVSPVCRHDGGEHPVVHVGKSPKLIIHELDEGWLGGLEDPEVPDPGSDAGPGAAGHHHLRHAGHAGATDEGVAVLLSCPVSDPLPGVSRDLGLSCSDPGVLGDEVSHKNKPELFGVCYPELLGQDIHGILLAVCGYDVLVVARLVVLRVVESEKCDHLQLTNAVNTASLGHVEDLHPGLAEIEMLETSFYMNYHCCSHLPISTVNNFEHVPHHLGKFDVTDCHSTGLVHKIWKFLFHN